MTRIILSSFIERAVCTEPDDALPEHEIDAIMDAAADAASGAAYPPRFDRNVNPYEAGTQRHEIYAMAYRNAYASANGY